MEGTKSSEEGWSEEELMKSKRGGREKTLNRLIQALRALKSV